MKDSPNGVKNPPPHGLKSKDSQEGFSFLPGLSGITALDLFMGSERDRMIIMGSSVELVLSTHESVKRGKFLSCALGQTPSILGLYAFTGHTPRAGHIPPRPRVYKDAEQTGVPAACSQGRQEAGETPAE